MGPGPPRALTKSGSNIIVSEAGSGIYISQDTAKTWFRANNSPPNVYTLCVSGSYVYGANNSTIYRSSDFGENWTKINDTLLDINALAANGSDIIAGRFYSAVHPDTVFPPPGGVFLSTDYGQTWAPFMTGLPDFPQVFSLAKHNNNFFVGLEAGFNNELYPGTFYTSTPAQGNWSNYGVGLPYTSIGTVYVNDSSIFVGTGNEGMWYKPLSQITSISQPKTQSFSKTFRLEQNYPNPFNPSTIIEYSLSVESKVKLEIYDILGRKISTLVNKIQKAGNHSVVFNGGNLASGIYFYRLSAGNFIETKKLVLLK